MGMGISGISAETKAEISEKLQNTGIKAGGPVAGLMLGATTIGVLSILSVLSLAPLFLAMAVVTAAAVGAIAGLPFSWALKVHQEHKYNKEYSSSIKYYDDDYEEDEEHYDYRLGTPKKFL